MSVRRVVAAVVTALAEHDYHEVSRGDGLVTTEQRDDRALRVAQLQMHPPVASGLLARLPGTIAPRFTVNLHVDHAICATTFGRELGGWPMPVERRLGALVANGLDAWWELSNRDAGLSVLATTDAAALAADLIDALVTSGLPWLEEMSDPATAYVAGAAQTSWHRAELAHVTGHHDEARTHLAAAVDWLAQMHADGREDTFGYRGLARTIATIRARIAA